MKNAVAAGTANPNPIANGHDLNNPTNADSAEPNQIKANTMMATKANGEPPDVGPKPLPGESRLHQPIDAIDARCMLATDAQADANGGS